MEETGKNPIQVAERLFQVIERLAENGPMGIMDLSAELGFHKSTTHRLVTSLQYMGYIRQDEESLKYALSLKFLEIGSKILEQTNMASLIHPSLKKLSEQTGETVHLVRREGTEAVYIDKVESTVSSIRMVSRVGSRIPLYCSGVGKALLAELPDPEIEDIWNSSEIASLTPYTVTESVRISWNGSADGAGRPDMRWMMRRTRKVYAVLRSASRTTTRNRSMPSASPPL